MAYKRMKTIDIGWKAGHELEDLHVTMKRLSIGKMADFAGLADMKERELRGAAALKVFGDITETIADGLVSWDLLEDVEVKDDDGNVTVLKDQPVPATLEGLRRQDLDFVFELMSAWMDLGAGVSDPLSTSSSGGLPSLEASIPMEILSPSPVS